MSFASDDFSKANDLYQKGEFAAAADLYERLAAEDPAEPSYLYNLGNARLKTGHGGRAVAAYLRAFRLAPRDGDIRYNLAFALSRAGDDLVPPGVPHALFLLAYSLSQSELFGLLWLSYWALCLLLGAHLLFSPRSPGRGEGEGLGYSAAVAFCLFLFFGGWRWLRATLEPDAVAVTVRSDAEIRSGPGANFSVSYTFPEGRRLAVLGKKDGWLEIASPKENIKGWIESASVESL